MLKTYPKLIELAMFLQQNPTWSSNQVCIAVLIACQQIIAEFMPEDKMDVGRELLAEWDRLQHSITTVKQLHVGILNALTEV